MARIRKFSAYQRIERPYTRRSKYSKKNFIRASPHNTIVRYQMGNKTGTFEKKFQLISNQNIQIRHNAIESSRLTANRFLEKLGKETFHLKICIYPHHILRENPLASGAGADRMSTGMKMSFGKPISLAAQVKKGQVLFEVSVNKENAKNAKIALKRASYKLPCSGKIVEAQKVSKNDK